MSDEVIPVEHQSNTGKWILLLLGIIYVVASGYFMYTLQQRLDNADRAGATNQSQIAELGKRVQATEASDETLAHQVGMTKKDLADRASQLQAQTRAAEARLEKEQKEQIS